MAFPLPAGFQDLFHREPYQEPALTGRDAFHRAILVVAGMVLGALVLSELPSRPFFRPKAPGKSQFVFSVVMAVLVGSHYLYKLVWRPWRDGPPGYRLVGKFEVREKNYLFAKCWVLLAPGNNYQLEVKPAVYEQLQVGSWVRLSYTAAGELVSLTRVAQ